MMLFGGHLERLRLKVLALNAEFDRATAIYAHAVELLERSKQDVRGSDCPMAIELAQEARDDLARCANELEAVQREIARLESGTDGA